MYTGDKYRYCRKCGKQRKFTKCPHCRGKGNTQTMHCGWGCGDGYWCSEGLKDQWHK